MTAYDRLDLLFQQNNGIVKTAQVLEIGIAKSTFYAYAKQRGIEQAAHGVYVSPDAWTDAMYLLHLAKVSGTETVELDKTKAALAEYFGVSRPSLEREMTRMQQEGLIVAERRRITISDKRKLAQLLHCIFTLVIIHLNT